MLSMHLVGLGFSSLPHTGLAYSEAVFAATHNSYSGDLDTESAAGRFSVFTSSGERGGILEQLAAGIRLLELDVHNFTIGHGFPCEGAPQYGLTIEACEAERPCHGAGCEVDHGDPETDTEGNPTTNTLVDWLHQVSVWSAQHPTHSPITICLDIKEVYGPWLGFGPWLGALDTMVRKEFSSIYTPAELAVHREAQGTAWPLVETMRGKVLFVLSGDTTIRVANLEAFSEFASAMFSEFQPGDPDVLKEANHFFAASSTASRDGVYDHIECIQLRTCPFRVWSYDFAEHGSGATPTFPAADYPYAPSYMDGLAATGRLVSAVV